MQEFRPASVISADTELAERFNAGDPEAIRELVDRYGAAVIAAVSAPAGVDAGQLACEVFVEAQRRSIRPGEDFTEGLTGIADEIAGPVDVARWELAKATASIDPSFRPVLRRHHLGDRSDGHDGALVELDDLEGDAARHEIRLQRRLAHLGGADEIRRGLAAPDVWVEAGAGLVECVLAATVGPLPGAHDGDDTAGPSARSRTVARLLRPVLLGIVGALVLLLVAIVVLSAASGSPAPPDYTVELTPTGAIAEVEGGEITVTGRDAGIEIELDAVTLPRRSAGSFYEGRLTLSDGNAISTGSFTEGVDVTLWAGASLDDAVVFEVVARELGGDTGDVVLKVDLPRE